MNTELEVGFRELRRVFVHQLSAVCGDFDDLLFRSAEDLLSLGEGSGIVQVDDSALGASQRLKGPVDDVLSGLSQHLHGHIVGDQILLDQGSQKLILGFRRGREADFNLFESDSDQVFEELQLLLQAHRNDQGLIAVAQVDAAPQGRFFDMVFLWPFHLFRRHWRGKITGSVLFVVFHVVIPPNVYKV